MKPILSCMLAVTLGVIAGSCSGRMRIVDTGVVAVGAHRARLVHSANRVRKRISGGRIVLHVYDEEGRRITWGRFRRMQENGNGSEGDNDVLLDPASLQVIGMSPLEPDNGSTTGDPSFIKPARATALAFAWPTTDGYSNIIVDLPASPGTYVYNVLAARQLIHEVDEGIAVRRWYAPSTVLRSADRTAHEFLARANEARTESQQGAYAARAMDAAVSSEVILLAQSGLRYAAFHRSAEVKPQWAVTLDTIDGGIPVLNTIAALYSRDGWIRIVFDLGQPPQYYENEVRNAQRLGLHVVGELLDSSDWASQSYAQWQVRVREYVSTLRTVDEWEVGNEANGDWLGPDVRQKIAYAAEYVKSHTRARTLLTLYWQLGDDDQPHEMFTWVHENLNAAITSDIDDVGMSIYPEEEPMGSAFDRVMTTLHKALPAQRLMITELDYWGYDGDHIWWWGSARDPYRAGRLAVANYYQAAVYSYPYSGGGSFWWYYIEEVLPRGSTLWNALHELHAHL
ncbi:MAG: hypothetical protein JO322_01910 [Candidatus Eremiobacteraeota bacterium]|nr:hypothetical protein [Candidatus Eremiobacteraeota bacterium]